MVLRNGLALLAMLAAIGCLDKADSFGTVPAAPEGAPLHLGVLPAVDADAAKRTYGPLAQEAGRAIGQPVVIVVAKSYAQLAAGVRGGGIQLAQLSPYMVLHAELGSQILVLEHKAKGTDYSGVFIVRDSSPYHSLQDLAGKRFAYVNAESSAGYYYPRMRLRKLGLDPDGYFGHTELAGSHQQVAERVSKGQADGGAVSWWTLPEALNLRVIDRTQPIPDDAIVYAQTLAAAARNAARTFFLAAADNPHLAIFFAARSVARYVAPKRRPYQALARELRRGDHAR